MNTSTGKADFINESKLDFVNIDSERYRKYTWLNGYSVTIENPLKLNVSNSGGHRVYDSSGKSHYIPAGWVHLTWEVYTGKANFSL